MSATYSEDANGSTLQLKVREEFQVSLAESRTGGYQWKVIKSGAPVLNIEELKSPAPDASVPGGTNCKSWRFTAQEPGSTLVQLQHLRSWEPNVPGREFHMQVEVSA